MWTQKKSGTKTFIQISGSMCGSRIQGSGMNPESGSWYESRIQGPGMIQNPGFRCGFRIQGPGVDP